MTHFALSGMLGAKSTNRFNFVDLGRDSIGVAAAGDGYTVAIITEDDARDRGDGENGSYAGEDLLGDRGALRFEELDVLGGV